MSTAMHLCLNANTRLAAHVHRANTFGSIRFMGCEGHQIHLHLFQIDGRFAGGLCGIGMKNNALTAAEFADLLDRLNHTDLIIHPHH